MRGRRKLALCGFMVVVLLPGAILVGFHGRPGSDSGSNVPNRASRPFVPTNPASMVSLTFDDGYASAYKYALPILDAAGLKSSQYIITGSLNQPGYMTSDQVLAMQANGHEIGAHTRTHPHLPELTRARLKGEVAGSLHDLEALGIHPTTFAYPYGEYDDHVVDAVKRAGFKGARTVVRGLDSAGTAPLLLKAKMLVADTTTQDVYHWIDEAQVKGGWLIIVFHRIDEDGNPISADHELVQETVDALVQRKIRVVTVSEGLNLLKLKP